MTEQDYIKATNLAKARIARTIVWDIMDGDEYGVNADLHKEVLRLLSMAVTRLEKEVDQ